MSWISVEERLPDDSEFEVDCWVYLSHDTSGPHVSRCWFRGDIWHFACAIYHMKEGIITHWMPYYTPEPPPFLFVGCSDSEGGETTVTTNEAARSDSAQPHLVVEYDTAAMDG